MTSAAVVDAAPSLHVGQGQGHRATLGRSPLIGTTPGSVPRSSSRSALASHSTGLAGATPSGSCASAPQDRVLGHSGGTEGWEAPVNSVNCCNVKFNRLYCSAGDRRVIGRTHRTGMRRSALVGRASRNKQLRREALLARGGGSESPRHWKQGLRSEETGRQVGPTLADYEGAAFRGRDTLGAALVSRHNQRMGR